MIGQGRQEDALEDFNEAIRLNPNFDNAYVNRAFAYTALGDDAAAQEDIDKAIELGIDSQALKEEIDSLKEIR